MQSAEPIEPHVVTNPCEQAPAGETWRADVASRVNSYRARRQHQNGNETSLDLNSVPASETKDFDAATLVSRNDAARNDAARNGAARGRLTGHGGEPRNLALPLRNPFDTNYYRRLNAESLAQSSGTTWSTPSAASTTAYEQGAGLEAESAAGMREEMRDAPCDPMPGQACHDLVLDLEIRSGFAADVIEKNVVEGLAENSFLERYRISGPEPGSPGPQTLLQPDPPPPAAQGNLLVFRRPLLEPPLMPQPSRDELAEPVNNRPRILEVPEDILPAVQGSLFPEIRLDADEPEEASNYHEPRFDVPLRVARVSERLIASLTDFGVVTAASLLFATIAWRALPEIPHTKPFFMVLGAVTLLLWAVYQHLFLLYAGRTPGMCLRGIRLRTFDGRVPSWRQRGSRARFLFISFASVALGFLWAFVDEDTLCWHDRISQTFPTAE